MPPNAVSPPFSVPPPSESFHITPAIDAGTRRSSNNSTPSLGRRLVKFRLRMKMSPDVPGWSLAGGGVLRRSHIDATDYREPSNANGSAIPLRFGTRFATNNPIPWPAGGHLMAQQIATDPAAVAEDRAHRGTHEVAA